MKLGEAWRKAAVALLLLLAMVLAGCSPTASDQPIIENRTVTVSVNESEDIPPIVLDPVIEEMLDKINASTNLTPVIVDSDLWTKLETNDRVLTFVILRSSDFFLYACPSRFEGNYRECWQNKTRKVDQVKARVFPLLMEDGFQLDFEASYSPNFAGYINEKGLKNLIKSPYVERVTFAGRKFKVGGEPHVVPMPDEVVNK